MRFSLFYLALSLLSITTLVSGHANHDGHDHSHDHSLEHAHDHSARSEYPGEISRVKRAIISKRDLFSACTTARTQCRQHVEQIYRNTPDYGKQKKACDTAYDRCIQHTIADREAFPINGQTGTTCAICQHAIQRTDKCFTSRCNSKHIFHSHCIQQYVAAGHMKCPICNNRNLS